MKTPCRLLTVIIVVILVSSTFLATVSRDGETVSFEDEDKKETSEKSDQISSAEPLVTTTIFKDDFESDDWSSPNYPEAWDTNGEWIYDDYYETPINGSYSGGMWAGYSAPRHLTHSIELNGDPANINSVNLYFKEKREQCGSHDNLTVKISTDGGSSWDTIDNYPGSGSGTHGYDITSEVSSANTFLLRFSMDVNGNDERHLIDDVEVVEDYINNPPDQPDNPDPSDGQTRVSSRAQLSVHITDPDGDSCDVSFYNAANDNLIGTDNSVSNDSFASTTWQVLSPGQSYSWYAVADDGADTAQSSTWSFTTMTLGEAVDNTALTWSTGGNNNWFGQTSYFDNDSDAAESGDIGDDEITWLETDVTGPGTLSFRWKVSSEGSYDYLRFYINGTEQDQISGTPGWSQNTYSISSGAHTLRWEYDKDTYVSENLDRGWVDDVVWNEQNFPPLTQDDSATTQEDSSVWIDVLSNDHDPDGSLVPSSVSVVNGPSHGSTSVNTSTGDIQYTPSLDYHGTDSFNYSVEDDDGATSNPTTVNITVNAVNDPPTAGSPIPNDGADGTDDSPTISAYVEDVDGDNLDITFYNSSSGSVIGTDTISGNGRASTTWSGLAWGHTYHWYVTVDDGQANVSSGHWQFTTNRLPVVMEPTPADGAIGLSNHPTLSVYVEDEDGDTMDITFHNATSGNTIGSGTVVSNGSASTEWSGLAWGRTYSWYVAVNDSTAEMTSTVWEFTTNGYPDVSNPSPSDGETGVSTDPTLSVEVTDPDNDGMDVTFYDGSDDTIIGSDTGVANGTTASITWNGLSPGQTYSWYVAVNDSLIQTYSSQWQFTTKLEPTINNPQPPNGTVGVPTDPNLSVDVTNPEGEPMNVTFYDASDDSVIGSESGILNETVSVTWAGLNENTTYGWYVEVDDGMSVVNSGVWHFTTIRRDVEVKAPSDVSQDSPGYYDHTFWVNNTGTVEDTYGLTAHSSKFGYFEVSCQNNITLGAGSSSQVVVEVHIKSSTPPGEMSNITLEATSQNDSSVNSMDVMSVYYEPYYVDVVAPSDDVVQDKGDHNYTFTVENTGGLDDTYELSYSIDNTHFSVAGPSIVHVPNGETSEVNVTITVENTANLGATAQIGLTAESQNSTTSDNESMNLTYEIHEVDVEAPQDKLEDSSGSYNYIFWVNNTGYANDTYDISVSCDNPHFTVMGPAQVSVRHNDSTTVGIEVTILNNATLGEGAQVILVAESQNSSVSDEDSMNILYGDYSVDVGAPSNVYETSLGSYNYTFWVNNTGSLNDTYTIDLNSDNSDFAVNGPSQVSIDAGDSMPIELEVIISSSVNPGDSASITLQATSENSTSTSEDSMTVSYITYGVEVDAPSDGYETTRGTYEHTFWINNTGSIEDTYDLSYTSDNNDFSVQGPSTVDVPAQGSADITVTIEIGSGAVGGESAMIKVNASSQNSMKTAEDSMIFSFENYGVEVTAPPDSVENSKDHFVYTFTVNNSGSLADSYTVEVDSDNPDFILEAIDSIQVEGGEGTTIEVEVEISSDVNSGDEAVITLNITSENSTVKDEDSMTVTYEKSGDLSPPSSEADPGDILSEYSSNSTIQISFSASDNTALQNILLYYKSSAENWTLWAEKEIYGTSSSGDFTFEAPGEGIYEFYTIAEDAAGNRESVPSESDTSVTIDTSGPTVTIDEPVSDSLLNTSELEIVWTGEDEISGISSYEIMKDGETWIDKGSATQHLYQGLEEGTHVVTVKAVDRAGNEKKTDIEFEIDMTPPSFSIISPQEDADLSQTSITISWSSESEVENYWIKLNGSDWTHVGTNTMYNISNISDGDYVVSIKGTDDAGNVNIREQNFTISSSEKDNEEDEGLLPFGSTCWLILLLIIILSIMLAIALITRRRKQEEQEKEEETGEEMDFELTAASEAVESQDSKESLEEMGETEEETTEEASEEEPSEEEIEPEESEETTQEATEETPSEGEIEEETVEEGFEEDKMEASEGGAAAAAESDKISLEEELEEESETEGTPPEADAGGNRTVQEGEMIEFDGKSSTDETEIISYEWYFDEWETAFGETVEHEFEEPGVHTVRLIVTNEGGLSAEDEIEVVVQGEESEEDTEQKEEVSEEGKEEPPEEVLEEFKQFKGIGSAMAERLYRGGFQSLDELKEAEPDDLGEIKGIGSLLSEKLHERIHEDE